MEIKESAKFLMSVRLRPKPMSTSFIEKIYSHPNGSQFLLLHISSPSKSFYIELPKNTSLGRSPNPFRGDGGPGDAPLDGKRLVLNKIKNGLQAPLFKFKLDIFGVGFKALLGGLSPQSPGEAGGLESSKLSLYLGRKAIDISIPDGIKVEVKKNGGGAASEIEISGA